MTDTQVSPARGKRNGGGDRGAKPTLVSGSKLALHFGVTRPGPKLKPKQIISRGQSSTPPRRSAAAWQFSRVLTCLSVKPTTTLSATCKWASKLSQAPPNLLMCRSRLGCVTGQEIGTINTKGRYRTGAIQQAQE